MTDVTQTQGMQTVLFAGGGTGGHIYPNLAVLERLRERGAAVEGHFVVSKRPLDAQILQREGVPFTALSAEPLRWRPDHLLRFLKAFRLAEAEALALIGQTQAKAVVATGGFVSGPVVSAAQRAGVPVALVNLDAVPGRANRWAAGKASDVFTVYPAAELPRAQEIGLPLRRAATSNLSPEQARNHLELDPYRPTLLVTAGSQGAETINRLMMELPTRTNIRRALTEWQVLHLAGRAQRDAVAQAYAEAKVRARVESFCFQMGLAWASATLAISRAGAGSVAEVWANAVPTIFLPYPYHRDEHQRFNAEPLVRAGGAMMLTDRIDPEENATQIAGPLLALMTNEPRRRAMRQVLAQTCPPDGADVLAGWLLASTGMAIVGR